MQDAESVVGGGESDTAEASLAGESSAKAGDMFFIVKSLTVEDLELSARNGIWATQAHNEAALNKAFEVRLRSTKLLLTKVNQGGRTPRTSISSSRPTSQGNISATHA